MKSFEDIFLLIEDLCKHGGASVDETMTPKGVRIPAANIRQVCTVLREDPALYFDMLACITAVDNGVEVGTIDLIYNLYSIPFNHHLSLKAVLPRENPEIESLQDEWKTANWHEREVWDMFGVKFKGHPDLRRILLPADWVGHPLRKDYKQQEYYRGVKVEY